MSIESVIAKELSKYIAKGLTKKVARAKLYERQIRRIKRAISRLEKQGWDINVSIPTKPKNITDASIRRLMKYTPDYIRKASRFVDVTTGEIIKSPSMRKVRKIKEEQEVYARQLRYIEVMRNEIEAAPHFLARQIIGDWFENLLDNKGYEYVADILENANNNGFQFEINIMSSDEEAVRQESYSYILELMKYDEESDKHYLEELSDFLVFGE